MEPGTSTPRRATSAPRRAARLLGPAPRPTVLARTVVRRVVGVWLLLLSTDPRPTPWPCVGSAPSHACTGVTPAAPADGHADLPTGGTPGGRQTVCDRHSRCSLGDCGLQGPPHRPLPATGLTRKVPGAEGLSCLAGPMQSEGPLQRVCKPQAIKDSQPR